MDAECHSWYSPRGPARILYREVMTPLPVVVYPDSMDAKPGWRKRREKGRMGGICILDRHLRSDTGLTGPLDSYTMTKDLTSKKEINKIIYYLHITIRPEFSTSPFQHYGRPSRADRTPSAQDSHPASRIVWGISLRAREQEEWKENNALVHGKLN